MLARETRTCEVCASRGALQENSLMLSPILYTESAATELGRGINQPPHRLPGAAPQPRRIILRRGRVTLRRVLRNITPPLRIIT